MKTHEINQFAFAGYYAVLDADGRLIAGRPAFTGGVTIAKPRLYNTPAAAIEAAQAMGGEPVELVAAEGEQCGQAGDETMEIKNIQGDGDPYYATVDGREEILSPSEYHTSPENADREPCQKCGRYGEWQGDECVRGIYSSVNDVILCSDCLTEQTP